MNTQTTKEMKEVLLEKFSPEKSSLVEHLIFDALLKQLEVKYKRGKHKGKTRIYKDIIREEFDYIITGQSTGKRLLSLLKRKHEEKKQSSTWGFISSFWGNYN